MLSLAEPRPADIQYKLSHHQSGVCEGSEDLVFYSRANVLAWKALKTGNILLI